MLMCYYQYRHSQNYCLTTIGASDHGVLTTVGDGGVAPCSTGLGCWWLAEAEEVNMSPLMSLATHSTVEGQNTFHMTLAPSISVRLQFELPIDGSELVRTPPKLSVAAQKLIDAHESDEIQAPESVETSFQDVVLPVGFSDRKI
jgi:hypothetical protein